MYIYIYIFNEQILKQKRGATIGGKVCSVLQYFNSIYGRIGGKILEIVDNEPCLWWRYIDDIFFIWKHRGEKLRNFAETLNEIQPTVKFTAEWSQKSIVYLSISYRR